MAQVQDNTRLFRGQGQVFLAERDGLGNPEGFEFVGNVSELGITFKTDAIEHTESQTGNNSLDAKIEKGLKIEATYKACSLYKDNLRRMIFGELTETGAGTTVTDETVIAYLNKHSALEYINLDSFASLTDEAGAVTYVEGTDYAVDLATGRISHAAAASYLQRAVLKANYVCAGEEAIAAFESVNRNFWLRFEGLNGAEDNSPVVIDIPKLRFEPMKELQAIGDEFNKFEQPGIALFDRYRRQVAGDKYSRYLTIRQVPQAA